MTVSDCGPTSRLTLTVVVDPVTTSAALAVG